MNLMKGFLLSAGMLPAGRGWCAPPTSAGLKPGTGERPRSDPASLAGAQRQAQAFAPAAGSHGSARWRWTPAFHWLPGSFQLTKRC